MDQAQRRAFFKEVVALAPMAKGGNLPYRRLCREFGAGLTCSEMILADKLVKGGERPLLRHHPDEDQFGIQLAGKKIEVMAEAAVMAREAGARFIDLNFGCPIDLVVRRGSGAALMKKPGLLARIVGAVRMGEGVLAAVVGWLPSGDGEGLVADVLGIGIGFPAEHLPGLKVIVDDARNT